jgi:hypothetical protein
MKYVAALATSLSFTNLSFISSFILLFAQAAPIATSYAQRSELVTLSILDGFDAGSLLGERMSTYPSAATTSDRSLSTGTNGSAQYSQPRLG